jgi:exodeoxyribonuclease VII small subunit
MSEKKATFNEMMERLDEITRQLNQPNLPLEKAMELFKEGLSLSKACEKALSQFENEMNELIVNNGESE